MKYGIIIVPSAWLFLDDFSEHSDEVLMGWAVRVTSEQKTVNGCEYVKVITHYGYDGFIRKDAIRAISLEELKQRDEEGILYAVTRPFADLLSEPRVEAQILLTVSRGSFVHLICEAKDGYWVAETADGTKGYLPRAAVSERLDGDGYLYTDDPDRWFLNQQLPQGTGEEQFRELVVKQAKQYLGTQYRWAGKTPAGIDCSGLTFMSYQMNGILIYRDANIRAEYPIRRIALEKMKKGDLMIFKGHVAMYIGDGRYIHCTGHKDSFGCVINSLKEEDPDYREDLAKGILAVGSLF